MIYAFYNNILMHRRTYGAQQYFVQSHWWGDTAEDSPCHNFERFTPKFNKIWKTHEMLLRLVYQLTNAIGLSSVSVWKSNVQSERRFIYKIYVQYSKYSKTSLFTPRAKAGCVGNQCFDAGPLSCLSSTWRACFGTRFSLASRTNRGEQRSVSVASEIGICFG